MNLCMKERSINIGLPFISKEKSLNTCGKVLEFFLSL